jgi:hypothetical protein
VAVVAINRIDGGCVGGEFLCGALNFLAVGLASYVMETREAGVRVRCSVAGGRHVDGCCCSSWDFGRC